MLDIPKRQFCVLEWEKILTKNPSIMCVCGGGGGVYKDPWP